MAIVDLALLKKHVKADDFSDDDQYLQHLLDAAEQHVCRATNHDVIDELDENGETPLPIVQAILMLAGHWYNQREAVSGVNMVEVPYSFSALLKPYRRLV